MTIFSIIFTFVFRETAQLKRALQNYFLAKCPTFEPYKVSSGRSGTIHFQLLSVLAGSLCLFEGGIDRPFRE